MSESQDRVLHILRDSFLVMQDQQKVCVGVFARNAHGERVEPTDPTAVCFCSIGIIRYFGALYGASSEEYEACLGILSQASLGYVAHSFLAVLVFHDRNARSKSSLFFQTWRKAVELAESAAREKP